MKNQTSIELSCWAKTHRPITIASIAFAKIAIGIIGFFLGAWAWYENILLPLKPVQLILTLVATAGVLAYPSKHLKKHLPKRAFYWRQKRLDGLFAAFGFAFFFFMGNLLPTWTAKPDALVAAPADVVAVWSSLAKPVQEQRHTLQHGGRLRQWMIQKAKSKLIKVMAKVERFAKNTNEGEKALLSVLLVLLALGLAYLILVGSCSLSCNGQEAMAQLLLFGGGGLLIIGVILGFRAIYHHKKVEEPVKSKDIL